MTSASTPPASSMPPPEPMPPPLEPMRPVPTTSLIRPPAPVGIGGWLIWPAIGLIRYPIEVIDAISALVKGLPVVDLFERIDWKALIYADIVALTGLCIFNIYIALQFFRKKESTPDLFVGFLVVHLIWVVLRTILASALGVDWSFGTVGGILLEIFWAVVWIAYWGNSIRVQNTFVVP